MQKYLSLFLIVFSLFLFQPDLRAQGPNPICDPIDNTDADGNLCPIDGGLGFLIAAGIGYGFFKNKRKQPEEDPS